MLSKWEGEGGRAAGDARSQRQKRMSEEVGISDHAEGENTVREERRRRTPTGALSDHPQSRKEPRGVRRTGAKRGGGEGRQTTTVSAHREFEAVGRDETDECDEEEEKRGTTGPHAQRVRERRGASVTSDREQPQRSGPSLGNGRRGQGII